MLPLYPRTLQRFSLLTHILQDLLKYTAHNHPDRITLQMSLARFEGIADYLNESKRATEQKSIVEYLNTRVSKLPFRLTDSRSRWLHRQDVVTRLVGGRSCRPSITKVSAAIRSIMAALLR